MRYKTNNEIEKRGVNEFCFLWKVQYNRHPSRQQIKEMLKEMYEEVKT